MKRDTESKITVEDLLRLKRAERPPAEFWATFEAEMRTKQLSAIVGRRTWWDGFSGLFAVVSRHQLSFGAAAAMVMAFAGYRYVDSHPVANSAPLKASAAPVAAAPVVAAPVQAAPAAVIASAQMDEVALDRPEAAPPAQAVAIATVSHLAPAPVTIPAESISKSQFVEGIAIKLADFREPASDYSRSSAFGSDREFEPSIAPARQAVTDPLARIDPAAERRARLLAPALPAYSGNSGALAGDWIRQRSSADDRMYESMDRGSNDDRTLVGFRF
jgi:hypothetical protein